ncbi:MAG: PQQ-dependent sugar dehydrogenase, partial [Blastopirellula sp. JB062]
MTSTFLQLARAALHTGLAIAGLGLVAAPANANEFFPRFSVENLVERNSHSTVTIGPDGHLYATTTNSGGREPRDNGAGEMIKEHLGEVWRYELDPASGHVVSEERLLTMPGPVNGFVFDPSATADNLMFYITVLNHRGHLNRVRVKPLGEKDPVIENKIVLDFLGRGGNHGMNNLVFTPEGKLYANQGGRTFWGTEEDVQTAAVLEIDLKHPDFAKGAVSPRDYTLKQMWGGDAPIQLVATGLRNPHGIVHHSNGEYYVTIHDPPRGPLLVGGPIKEEVVSDGPPDLVARLKRGAYYGHANPHRKEWVSYGGNPTAEVDPFEIPEYPVGTMPLPNFDLSLMIGTRRNHCISGLDEYLNGDLLAGYLYAQGAEGINLAGIERFVLDEEGNFTGFHEFLKDENNEPIAFQGVMDVFVTEKGWIYVANFGRRRGDGGLKGGIELLKPLGGNIPPSIAIQTPENRSVYAKDASIDFAVEAQDYDGQVDKVLLLVNGQPQECVQSANDGKRWTAHWKRPSAGRYEVRAKAVDNDGKSVLTKPLYLQVDADARPPVITEMPSSVAFVDAEYASQVEAEDQPNVRFSLKDAPEGMKIDPQSGKIVWTPRRSGTYTVSVIADNGIVPTAQRTLKIEAIKTRPAEYPTGTNSELTSGVEFIASLDDHTGKSGAAPDLSMVAVSKAPTTITGFLDVPKSGVYEFAAPDSLPAKLSIGAAQVFDGQGSREGRIPLEAGKHAFTYQVDASDAACGLEMRGPGDSARSPVSKKAFYRYARAYGLNNLHGAEPYLKMPKSELDFLPEKLSETGAFQEVASMTLAPGAIEYDVNSPLWSDGAFKRRWAFVPAGQKVEFSADEPWKFPPGTVFVKHFALGEERKRIETRLT